MFNSEDIHYDLCNKYNLKHISYVYPLANYINMLTEKEICDTFTSDVCSDFAQSMEASIKEIARADTKENNNLWDLFPDKISRYGLLDYVAIGNIPFGVDALYNLGFRSDLTNYPYPYDEFNTGQCYMNFFHPNRDGAISYEDTENHNFCKLWHALRLKQSDSQ